MGEAFGYLRLDLPVCALGVTTDPPLVALHF